LDLKHIISFRLKTLEVTKRRRTTTVASIVGLASSASTSFTIHWLTTLLLLSTQTNGVLDALHDFWNAVQIVGVCRLMISRRQNGVLPPTCAIRWCLSFGLFVEKVSSQVQSIERRDVVRRSGVPADKKARRKRQRKACSQLGMARTIICATRGKKLTERYNNNEPVSILP
jgi:hypothetical protein